MNSHRVVSTQLVTIREPVQGSEVTILELERPNGMKYHPGQYCFIRIPSISYFQWHPFSLTSSPHENPRFSFHIHSNGKGTWTGRLYEKTQESSGGKYQ